MKRRYISNAAAARNAKAVRVTAKPAKLVFSDVRHVRCPNCNYRVPIAATESRSKE